MRVRRYASRPLLGPASAVAVALVAVATMLQVVGPGALAASPKLAASAVAASASAARAHPAAVDDTAVVGRTTHFVVVNDRSTHSVYLANVGGHAAPRAILRRAHAVAVAGDLVEYVSHRTTFWRKLGTRRHGRVPASWTFLAPDGGLHVRRSGQQTYLDYLHLSGRVQHLALPAGLPVRSARYSVVASRRQLAVAVSAAHSVPRVAFASGRTLGPFRLLRTTGLRRGSRLRCDSVVATGVGCADGRQIVRLWTDGRTRPQVSILGPLPIHVAVTDSYTTWTASQGTSGRACPCVLASLDTTGTAESIISEVTAPFVTAGYGRFYYSAGSSRRTAGVYETLYAGGRAIRIAALPGA